MEPQSGFAQVPQVQASSPGPRPIVSRTPGTTLGTIQLRQQSLQDFGGALTIQSCQQFRHKPSESFMVTCSCLVAKCRTVQDQYTESLQPPGAWSVLGASHQSRN